MVYSSLQENGFQSSVYITTGALNTTERLNALLRFDQQKIGILVATDIVGIDFKEVKFIINFDHRVGKCGSPDYKGYIYRVGRSGRFGRNAIAFNLVVNSEELNLQGHNANHFGFELIAI